MAFEIVDQHKISEPVVDTGSTLFLAGLRRPAAATLALLVTSALLWALISRLVAMVDPEPKAEISNSLKLFAVSDEPHPPGLKPIPEARAVASPPPRPALVAPPPPMPVEWSTARIRVPVLAPAAPSPPVPPQPETAGANGAAGQGNARGGSYDPYAGATPMRREGPVMANGLAARTASVDRSVLEAIHGMLRARAPGLRGQVMVLVVVTPDGRVASVERLQGSVGSKTDEMLSELLRTFGRFPPTGKSYRLRLPAFTF